MSLQEFWNMGGHVVYVWGSFGAVAVVMLCNLLLPVIQHRSLIKQLSQQGDRHAGASS